jgi:putrescine aminotransferase
VGAAVALANLDIIEREGLCARAAELGPWFLDQLRPLEDLPAVAEVRGVGLMLGIELVGDRDATPVAAGARASGVIVRATGQKIVLSPPLVVDKDDLARIAEVLQQEIAAL